MQVVMKSFGPALVHIAEFVSLKGNECSGDVDTKIECNVSPFVSPASELEP